MRIKQSGDAAVELFLLACSWYGAVPDLQLGSGTRVAMVGHEFYGKPPEGSDETLHLLEGAPASHHLAPLSRALDDLRRLGKFDLQLNHP